MKLLKYISIALCLTAIISTSFAQNTFRRYPTDLKQVGVVFLAYEQFEVDAELKKSEIKAIEFRNVKAKQANEQLKLATEKYPYEFIIATRSELDKLKEQGFRYVLENDMMNRADNPNEKNANMNSNSVSEMYLMDLENGDKYYLFQIVQSYVYFYKGIMKKFINQVEKDSE